MQARNPNNAKGIDVSHWQGPIDWAKVKSAGISFAIMKATEGVKYTDDTVSYNVSAAKQNGLAVGVYHFCRASNVSEAIAEANFFCSVISDLGGVLDIPPILDIETVNANTRPEVVAICKVWLSAVEKKLGVRPMIYSFPYFIDTYLDESLCDYPLWYANYGGSLDNRAGWQEWTILQHTDKGIVPGISGNVDMNEYNGSVVKVAEQKTYTDVPAGHWAANAISVVTAAGLMEGYEDGTFRPEKPITRAELAMVANHLLYTMNNKGFK